MTPPLGAFTLSGLGGFRSSGLGAWAGDDAVEVLGHIRVDVIHGRRGPLLWFDKGLLITDNYAPVGSVDGQFIFRITLADLYYWANPLTDANKQVLLDGVALGPDSYFSDSVRYPDNLGRVTRVSNRVVEIDYSPQILDRGPQFNAPGPDARDNTCGINFTSSTAAGHELAYNVADDSLEVRTFDAGVFNSNHRIGYGGNTLTSVPSTVFGVTGVGAFTNEFVEDVSTSGTIGYGGSFTLSASFPLPTPSQFDSGYARFDWMAGGQVGDMAHLYTSTNNPRSGLALVASFPISDLHSCRLYFDTEQWHQNFWPISGGMLAAVEWPKDGEGRSFFQQDSLGVHIIFLDTEPDPQLRCHLEFSRAGT